MAEDKLRTTGWPAQRVTGVDVWPFRMLGDAAEFLLLHRSGRDGSPFWQGVSGWIEPDEAPHIAALREETGLAAVALYGINAVFDLYAWRRAAVETIVPFAAQVGVASEPILSEEHDAWQWAPLAAALELVPYEPQRATLRRIGEDILARPEMAYLYRIETRSERPEKTR